MKNHNMKVNPNKLQILQNYVLVKPDANYESIQSKGTETGIFLPDFIYEKDKQGGERKVSVKERNFSVYGKVYAVPGKIGFHREEIKSLNNKYTVAAKIDGEVHVINRSVMNQIGSLTESSCLYETECEVEVGDRVKFSYLAHKSASEKKICIDTEEGEMYLIKYDMLTMVVNPDNTPKRMLNGYILVEPEEDERIKTENGVTFTESEGGLILPTFKHKHKKNRKQQKGTVLFAANKVGGYLQHEGLNDPNIEVKQGGSILYDPRGASRHEHHFHQEYSGKPLQLIQRRDIITTEEEIDLNLIEIKRK